MQCKYPTQFKRGVISQVPKPGDPLETKSWRPVTIISALSKPLEKVLNKQLKTHLVENGLISEEQHANQAGKSVTTAWKELETITLDALDRKKLVAYQLQDMSAALNLVDRSVLVPKLAKLGCSEYMCRLIDSYMTGRSNRVKVNNVTSEPSLHWCG